MITTCICGAGTMGSGIAQVCATAGFSTVLFDVNTAVLSAAKEKITADLQRSVDKGRTTLADKEAALNRLRFTSDINQCTADLIIEAIVEKPEVKLSLFRQLAAINTDETILATNTSSLSVSALAKEIKGPQRFAGLHFFNPAPLMKLVEVVRADTSTPEVTAALVAFTKQLGKVPVVCTDAPGFIVNRVARPYYIESLRLAEGGAAIETIDRLLEGLGFKLGPFRLMDLIGNDINYAVSCSIYDQLQGPERLKPSYLQQEKVARGELGKKSGKGWYGSGPLSPSPLSPGGGT